MITLISACFHPSGAAFLSSQYLYVSFHFLKDNNSSSCCSVFFMKLLQNRIGADIIMALDDVVRTTITGPRIEEAMYRTLRWIDRCIAGNVCLVQQ